MKAVCFAALLSAALWGISIWQGAIIKPYAGDIQIRYHGREVTDEAFEGLKTAGEKGGIRGLSETAAWNVEYGIEVKNPVLSFKQTAVCIVVEGAMDQVVKDRLIAGNYGFADDEDGCVVSSKTAWELFGSTEVTGQWITVGGESFLIRGVTAGSVSMVMVPAKRMKTEGFSNVSLSFGVPQGLEGAANETLMRYGFPGKETTINGSFFWAVVRFAQTLPCWALLVCACMAFRCAGKAGAGKRQVGKTGVEERQAGKMKAACRVLGVVCAAACAAALVWYGVRFPDDFIPSRWSDFSFYAQKIAQIRENMLKIAMLPLAPWDVVIKRAFVVSVLCSAEAAVLIIVTGSLFIPFISRR